MDIKAQFQSHTNNTRFQKLNLRVKQITLNFETPKLVQIYVNQQHHQKVEIKDYLSNKTTKIDAKM